MSPPTTPALSPGDILVAMLGGRELSYALLVDEVGEQNGMVVVWCWTVAWTPGQTTMPTPSPWQICTGKVTLHPAGMCTRDGHWRHWPKGFEDGGLAYRRLDPVAPRQMLLCLGGEGMG